MKISIICFITAFFITVVVAPVIIKFIKKLKAGQNILGYVESHKSKQGTPTMGGVLFAIGAFVSFAFYSGDNYKLALVVFAGFLAFGILGFLDDFIKIKFKQNEGLKPYQKIIGQVGVSTLIAFFVYFNPHIGGDIILPFTDIEINIGWGIIPFVIFVFLAVTNAVNLTDGLDGLAGGVGLTYLISFFGVLFVYVLNLLNNGANPVLIDELGNVLVLISGVGGSILAFLIFNCNKATLFMGDTGSLALGGFIAGISCLTKFYLLIPLIGIMFVASAVSVIIQVAYYKLTKKRVFLMAPLHHHFEKKGCYENRIVVIYISITAIIGLGCLLFSI